MQNHPEESVTESASALSLTQQMRGFSREERRKIMMAAAESSAEYYRTDPESLEWQALDGVDFYDIDDCFQAEIQA